MIGGRGPVPGDFPVGDGGVVRAAEHRVKILRNALRLAPLITGTYEIVGPRPLAVAKKNDYIGSTKIVS